MCSTVEKLHIRRSYKMLNIPKELLNAITRRRADNAMAKRKRTNNNLQNNTQKTKDGATRITLQNSDKLSAPEGLVDHVPHVIYVELMIRFRLRVIGVYAYINYIKLQLSCLDHLVYLILKSIKLFGLMKVIAERCRVHYIRYLRVDCYTISLKSIHLTLILLCPDKTV